MAREKKSKKGASGACNNGGKRCARGRAHSEVTAYDSIGAAAAGLGVSVAVLRKAKRAGAPGFRGSRVYPGDLLPWLQADRSTHQAADDKDSLERRLLAIKIERQQFAYQVDKKDFVLSIDAARWATELVSEFTKALDAVPSTLAPDIVGVASIAEAELRIRAALDQVRRTLHESPWASGTCTHENHRDTKGTEKRTP